MSIRNMIFFHGEMRKKKNFQLKKSSLSRAMVRPVMACVLFLFVSLIAYVL